MSGEQRRDTDSSSGISIEDERKVRNDETRKRLNQLPFVVITKDIDEPSDTPKNKIRAFNQILARTTIRGRKNRALDGDWTEVPTGRAILQATSSTNDVEKSGGKKEWFAIRTWAWLYNAFHRGNLRPEKEHHQSVRHSRSYESVRQITTKHSRSWRNIHEIGTRNLFWGKNQGLRSYVIESKKTHYVSNR